LRGGFRKLPQRLTLIGVPFETSDAVKSLSEFLELQTAFVRKQIEGSAEQAKVIQALMLGATEDVSKPIKDAFVSALKERKAA